MQKASPRDITLVIRGLRSVAGTAGSWPEPGASRYISAIADGHERGCHRSRNQERADIAGAGIEVFGNRFREHRLELGVACTHRLRERWISFDDQLALLGLFVVRFDGGNELTKHVDRAGAGWPLIELVLQPLEKAELLTQEDVFFAVEVGEDRPGSDAGRFGGPTVSA